jgi:beta-aspartyl-dipeptidase (metallo-type)
MLTLIENGEVFTPDRLGRTSVLLAGSRVVRVGRVDRRGLDLLGVEHRVVDASGCLVVPGLVDPHVHLLGGSGESGFNTQTPEFFPAEIVRHGTTTVVGTLGVDTTMKTMAGLLAKAKGLKQDGLNAFVWTGGYDAQHASILSSVRDDVMFIEEVIGAGEVAISDGRAMELTREEIARLASDAHVGGMLSGKAGITHFHVGEQGTGLAPLRDVLEHTGVEPGWLYATHVQRSEKLMREAVQLARKGMAVDCDVIEHDAPRWLRFYRDHDGPPDRLTFSSDASATRPGLLYEALRGCVANEGMPLEDVLPHFTRNTAAILKLGLKGELAPGKAGDVLVLAKDGLDVVHVLSLGEMLVEDGELVMRQPFLEGSDREIHLVGKKAHDVET